MSITEIKLSDLTEATVAGEGVFDVLMRATKSHLEEEFRKSRITGPEYSTVYLGSVQQVLQASLEFLLQRNRIELEAQLLEQQIILAGVEVDKARAQVALTEAQTANAQAELLLIQANGLKIPAEIAHIQAQTGLVEQNTLNAETQNLILQAEKCKLDAEFDLIRGNTLKAAAETGLLEQKIITERAQTASIGVDEDSVIGRQKRLYKAQTDGFARDAEQKVAKIMTDAWGIQRSTDEATQANATNKLDAASIGRAVQKMFEGVGV